MRYPFKLKLTESRVTKVGDFCPHNGSSPVITINRDLNPFLFLVTFIHEFSHHAVQLIYGNKPQAHGKEWKLAFKTFMGPLLEMEVFPADLHYALQVHLKNPMASSYSDSRLTQLLRCYNNGNQPLLLKQVEAGALFILRRKTFRKGKLRRTRFSCIEIGSGLEYLVPADAEITRVEI